MNEQKQEQNENETHVENKNVVHVEQRTHSYHYSTDPDDHYFGVGG